MSTKENKTKQEHIAQFYKDILRDVGGEHVIDKLIEAMENSTGLKITEPQRQYLENYMNSSAMKWARVMQALSEGMQDPNIMRDYKRKVEKG